MVSLRSSAYWLCGVSGFHGSTKSVACKSEITVSKYDSPSPSIIANRSAAIAKSPSTLTAVMFGKGGTWKCFPGGNAWGRSFPYGVIWYSTSSTHLLANTTLGLKCQMAGDNPGELRIGRRSLLFPELERSSHKDYGFTRTVKYPHSVHTWKIQARQRCEMSVFWNLESSYDPKHWKAKQQSNRERFVNYITYIFDACALGTFRDVDLKKRVSHLNNTKHGLSQGCTSLM